LPRRMWAGCQTKFFKPLRIGDQIKKISSVFDINLKNGKSGLLCFVTAKYGFDVNEELVIEEFHDIVYRNFSKEDKDKKPELTPVEKLLQDNQISRAVDLIRGINLFSNKKKVTATAKIIKKPIKNKISTFSN